MTILSFDGVDDYVQSSTLGFDLTAAFTVGGIFQRGSLASFQSILTIHDATTPRVALETITTDAWQLEINGAASDPSTTTTASLTDDIFIAFSKPAGSALGRFHFKNLTSLAAVIHETGNAAISDPVTQSGGFIKIGNYGTGNTDDWNGLIGLVFAFNQDIGDAGVNEILTNFRTSDIWNYSGGRPKLLVECTSLTPIDIAGLSTFNAATGATLTGANPDNWNLNGNGTVVSSARPSLPRRLGPRAVGPTFFAGLYKERLIVVASQQTIAAAQAVETEVANAITPSKTRAVGQAIETETANAVGRIRTLTQAIETETANAITPLKTRAVGQAVETETANTILVRPIYVAAGQAIETETANAITPSKLRAVGQSVETEAANAITPLKTRAVGQATETETANAVTPSKLRAVGQSTETEAANAVTPKKSYLLSRADELELAQAISRAAVGSDGAGLPVFVIGPTRTVRIVAKDTRSDLARGALRTTYGRVELRTTRGSPKDTRTTSGRVVARSTSGRVVTRLTRIFGILVSKTTWGNARSTKTSRTRSTKTVGFPTVSKTTRGNVRTTSVIPRTVYGTHVYGQIRIVNGRVNNRTTRVVRN